MTAVDLRRGIGEVGILYERLGAIATAPEVERARLYLDQASRDLSEFLARRGREMRPAVPR